MTTSYLYQTFCKKCEAYIDDEGGICRNCVEYGDNPKFETCPQCHGDQYIRSGAIPNHYENGIFVPGYLGYIKGCPTCKGRGIVKKC